MFPKSLAFGSFSRWHYDKHLRFMVLKEDVPYCVILRVQTEVGLGGGTQKVGQEEREIFYLVMLSSGASYTLASKLKFLYFFFSLPKSSVRVLAHVFIFSLNPAEGVEQLKCLRLCLCWNYSVAQRRKYCGIGTEKGGDTLCVSQTCG